MNLALILVIVILGSTSLASEWGVVGVYSSYNQTPSTQTGSNTNLNYTGSPASGYGGGLVQIWPLSNVFSFEMRALYISEGLNTSYSGTLSGQNVTGTATQTAPFFEFPLLLNLNLGSKFALHGGGFFSLATGNISTNVTVNVSGTTVSNSSNTPNTTNDYGVVGGLEFKTEISQTVDFFISVDYLYGLANQEAGASSFSANYSRAIQGVAGFLFRP